MLFSVYLSKQISSTGLLFPFHMFKPGILQIAEIFAVALKENLERLTLPGGSAL